MTEPVKPARRRKPLRRTAWSMLIGGLLTLGLMIGAGLLLLAGGQDIGPGRPAVWPAGERASVHKHPGPQDTPSQNCEVIGSDGRPEYRWLDWAESVRSPTEVTIRCEQEAIFLTGSASAVASVLQSPLILLPVGVVLVGLPLFFPRFAMLFAALGHSGKTSRSLLRRLFGQDP